MAGVSAEVAFHVGLSLPGVQPGVKRDGSAVLRAGGRFMAGIATHRSAEPRSMVVRFALEDRQSLLQDMPDAYYVTEYYRKHAVVLVRLDRVSRDVLYDLLATSRRLALGD